MVNKTSGRRIDAHHIEYRRLAENAEVGSVSRSQLIRLAKKLRMTGFIKDTECNLLLALLDTASVSSFEEGGIPIVFKSNQRLGIEISRSDSRVSRLLSILYDKGLIVMRDSGNFKRYSAHNSHNNITTACGIDLRILIARYCELQQKADDILEDLEKRREALRCFRGLVRQIKFSCASEITPFTHMLFSRVQKVICIIGRPSQVSFEKLKKAIRFFEWILQRFFDVKMSKTTYTYVTDDMHIHNTNPYPICKSNTNTQKTNHSSKNKPTIMNSDKSEYSSITNATSSRYKNNSERNTRETEATPYSNDGVLPQIKPETLISAMPNVSEFLDNKPNSVDDLTRSTEFLAKMTGISPDAVKQARETMGFKKAALAIGIILEKYTRQLIHSPGGYLRGMIDKEKQGELYLRYCELQQKADDILEDLEKRREALRCFRGLVRQIKFSCASEITPFTHMLFSRVQKVICIIGRPSQVSFEKLKKAIRFFEWILQRFFDVKMSKTTYTYVTDDMHIHNTNPYPICKSNTNTQKTNHSSKNKPTIMNSDKSEYSSITNATSSRYKNNSERDTRETEATLFSNDGVLPQIKPETLVSAMPNVSEFLDNKLNSVDDLVSSTEFLAKMTGISPDAVKQARETMGFKKAALAIGIILEKYARQLIHSPGGYLRGMIDKEKRGELYLERSIYGLLNSNQQTVWEK
ncbi:plasmid replication protein RepC [Bartonella melophagi]|nr:plasmid replication protein RepC [Bartonella melophagi]